jgi:hypothetical protein
MRNSLSVLLFTLFSTFAVFAQPGDNIEFNYYERNPVMFLLLSGAGLVLIIVLAFIFIKRRK